MNYKIRYNPDEILQIFNEQHRLCGSLNSMVDTSFILTKNTLIREWQDALDLINWKKLAHFFNKEFRIEESLETWNSVLNPDDKRTLGDLCAFIAKVAEKEVVNPIKILGTECFSASTFLTLKRNLKNKGVDVTNLLLQQKLKIF